MVTVPPAAPDALALAVAAIAEAAGRRIEAVRAAGRADADVKRDGSPVTAADRAAEAVIVERLAALRPGVPIVSEEQPIPPPDERAAWREWWLVDPLDGTKELLAGRPEYTVNIALIRGGVPVLGIVHVPASGVTYLASADAGSWRRDAAGALTRLIARPPVPGAALRIAESRSHRSPELDAVLARYRVGERIAIGSSLKFCLVAEGGADCYIRLGPTMEWDVAAGDAVFRWASSGPPHPSPLSYDKPDLRNGAFTVGFLPPPPAVVWFTGLSGAGKSTIARLVVARLAALGVDVELLDGDAIRAAVPGIGFTRPERDAHLRHVGYAASRLEAHGVTAVAALITPYDETRRAIRALCRRFVEVYVTTPLAVCEQRDPKGLYARARAGEIAHFTGIDDPFDVPARSEIVVDTQTEPAEAAAARIVTCLQAQALEGSRA